MKSRQRLLVSVASALVLSASVPAFGQATPLPEGVAVGGWTFRPMLEVRVRGEYRRHPVDTGGQVLDSRAVLGEGPTSPLPSVVDTQSAVFDQIFVAERSRIGLAVDRGPVTAALTLQDARVLGSTGAAYIGPGEPSLPSFEPSEAYVDVHARTGRKMFLRLGRQRVGWGDGRLVGDDDWSPTGRALDAARFGVQVWDIDIEAMGVLLAAPAGLPPSATGDREPAAIGSGAQLYGLDLVWRLFPVLNVEATGLARVVRIPFPAQLTPGDTFVTGGRIFGDRRGFRYAVEGAYEFGRVGVAGGERDLGAFAVAGKASLETSLFWHLTLGVEGAYASGDDGKTKGTQTRFDPILPSQHDNLGPMGLFAWSNIFELGGTLALKPLEELDVLAGYRWVNLADPNGRWTTASLFPVGQSSTNKSSALGNEIDLGLKLVPWKPIEFQAGYGIFINGDGARRILGEAGRPATIEHYTYLQALVHAP